MTIQKTFRTVSALLLLASILFTPAAAFAQVTEEERNQQLEKELLMSLPLTSENPNHVVTFTDPSGKGVKLAIDGKDAATIKSPYTLPTLGIGKHTFVFTFKDKEQTPQTLTRDFVIIPRPPQIKTPLVQDGILTFTGTGLAGAQLELMLTSTGSTQTFDATVDTAGNWTFTTPKKIDTGRYTLIALARKNGYSSKYSQPSIFDVGEVNSTSVQSVDTATNPSQPIFFRFGAINSENITRVFTENKDLIILLAAVLVCGLLLGLFFGRVFRNKETRQAEHLLKSVFQNGGIAAAKKCYQRLSRQDWKRHKKRGQHERWQKVFTHRKA